jgi:two-component system, NtrC family, C4-dicarboxylate transport sensor histidine kinase DctB
MRTYRRWLLTLVETRRSGSTFGAWVLTSTFVLLILYFAAYVDPIRQWFHLPFWSALLCYVPMMTLGFVAGWAESRRKLTLFQFGSLILLGAVFFQFFWAALVALSSGPGAFVMASIFLLTVTFHGYMHRVTRAYPFGLFATGVAVAGALWLCPTPEARQLVYFIGATGGLLSLITGGVGLRMHHNVVQSEALKQALYYRALNEKSREHIEMSQRVLNLLKYNHDAGNTLSAVFLHAQLLEDRIASDAARNPEVKTYAPPVSVLLTQLDRLKQLINGAHRIGDEVPTVEAVPLSDIVEEVVRDTGAFYPHTTIRIARADLLLSVRMHDGAAGFRRVIENVLRNACEGNGQDAATHVQITVGVSEDKVCIAFQDDGPGFTDAQLSEPPTALATTKTDGHGLGLYNVNELVSASGGSLTRVNPDAGGAIVTVWLRQANAVVALQPKAAEEAQPRQPTMTSHEAPGLDTAPDAG